jgi:hypothetical protein
MPRRKPKPGAWRAPGSPEQTSLPGFYESQFKPGEKLDLETVNGGLRDEINLLRIVMRRALEQAEEGGDLMLEDYTRLLNALSGAAARLAILIKAQQELGLGDGDEVAIALRKALESLGHGED